MRNIWKTLFIVLLCVILVAAVALCIAVTNFQASGIRFLGSAVHFGTRQTCYLIDPRVNEIIDQGEFRADVYGFPKSGVTGIFHVDLYPLSMDDEQDFSFRRVNGDLVVFDGSGIRESAEYLGKEWTRYYNVWVCPDDWVAQPKAIVIEIFNSDKYLDRITPNMIAVCAQTEEEAWANYEAYLDRWDQ